MRSPVTQWRPEESLRFTHLLNARPRGNPHSGPPSISRPSSSREVLRRSSLSNTPKQEQQGALTPFGGEAAADDRLGSMKDNAYVPVSSPPSSTRNHQSTFSAHSKTTKTGRPLGCSGLVAPNDKDTVHTCNSEANPATTLISQRPAHAGATSRRDYPRQSRHSTSRLATATAHDLPVNQQHPSSFADRCALTNEKEGESSQAISFGSVSRGGPREKSERDRHPNEATTNMADRLATSTSGARDRIGDATKPVDCHGARNNDALGLPTVCSPQSVAARANPKIARARDAPRTSRSAPSAMYGSLRSRARSAARSVTPRTRDSAGHRWVIVSDG